MQRKLHIFIVFIALCFSLTANADRSLLYKKSANQFIQEMVNQYSFDKRQLRQILLSAQFQPQIIASMERPYEKKNWDESRASRKTIWRSCFNDCCDYWHRNIIWEESG